MTVGRISGPVAAAARLLRRPILASAFVAVVAAGCAREGMVSGMAVFAGRHIVPADRVVSGEVVVLGGRLDLERGSTVEGSLHVLGGEVRLNGRVRGDVSASGGRTVLGESAWIEGGVNVGGGDWEPDPAARVAGPVRLGSGPRLPNVEADRPTSPQGAIGRILAGAVLVALASGAAARAAPRASRRAVAAATGHVAASAAMGTLVLVVAPSLLVAMAFTVVLAPLAVFLLAAGAVTTLLGWTVLGIALGRGLQRRRAIPSKELSSVAGGLVVGAAAGAAFLAPAGLGLLVLLPLTALGTGALFLTGYGMRTYVPPSDPIVEAA